MIGRHVHTILALTCLAGGACDRGVQRRIELAATPDCETCSIELDRIATLGGPNDPALADGIYAGVYRDGQGFFYVAQTDSLSQILVYDSLGVFSRLLGRPGTGLGEYRFTYRVLIDAHDSLLIFDPGNGRLTVLAPETRIPVRAMPFPEHFFDVIRVSSGGFVISASVHRGMAMLGSHLHHVGHDGVITRSFGADSTRPSRPVLDRGDRPAVMRLLATDGDRFWAADAFDRYLVELWTADGARLQTIAGSPAWDAEGRQIIGMVLDSAGRLWVASWVQDPSWKPPTPPPPEQRSIPIPPRSERMKRMNTVIDVIDVRRGRLLASVRRPEGFVGFDGQNLLASFAPGPDGFDVIDVWRVRLMERP